MPPLVSFLTRCKGFIRAEENPANAVEEGVAKEENSVALDHSLQGQEATLVCLYWELSFTSTESLVIELR